MSSLSLRASPAGPGTAPGRRTRAALPIGVLPIALALVLGAFVFGPALLACRWAFVGRAYVDAWGTQWFYWFTSRQLAAGQSLGHTDLFFHPWGKDVYLHTGGNVLDAILAAPLRALLGPTVGYAVFVLGIVLTNTLAMRSLLARLGIDTTSAALAAVFFAFNPFLLHEIRDGRPTQALLGFLLLFVSDYVALETDTRRWVPVRAGAWLALTGLTYWYNAVFAGIAAGLLGLVRTAAGPHRPRVFARHAAAGAVALVLVAPFALPMLRSGDVPGLLDASRWTLTSWSPTTREGVDIGLYVFRTTWLTSGFYAVKGTGGLAFLPRDRNVLPAQVLLLAAGLVLAPPRVRRAALVLVGVSLAIATGPMFLGVPNLVYRGLVHVSTVFQRLWWPSRALVLGQVGIGIASAWAFQRLERGRLVAVGLLAAWWLHDLHAAEVGPMDTWSARVPAVYHCLAQGPAGAVLELPYARTQAHLWYQTVHGHPLFGGMIEENPVFTPPEQVAFRTANTFVSVLLDQAAEAARPVVFDPRDREALHKLGYRWVVFDRHAPARAVDPGAAGAEIAARAPPASFAGLLGAPVWADADDVLYAPWGDGSPCGSEMRQ